MNRLVLGLIIVWLFGLTVGLSFSMVGRSHISDQQIDERINQQLAERERKIVAHYAPGLRRIVKDFGLKPTEPTTIIEMIDVITGIATSVSGPNELGAPTSPQLNTDSQPAPEPVSEYQLKKLK